MVLLLMQETLYTAMLQEWEHQLVRTSSLKLLQETLSILSLAQDLSQGDLSRLINNAPDCSPALRLRFEARRVVAENVYVSYRPRQKPCPECGEPVGCRANECPGCGYDFKAAREAPAPVSLTRRGAATLGVRIKLGGRVAPGKLVASVRAEPAQRRVLRAVPRAACRDDEADSNAAAATRSAMWRSSTFAIDTSTEWCTTSMTTTMAPSRPVATNLCRRPR